MNVYAASTEDFTDVKGHWAYDSINFVVENGLFEGVSDTEFAPDAQLDRAMYVTALGRYYESLFGNLEDANDNFNDTTPNSWYSKYVSWATESNIIDGYGDGNFGPHDILTREQAVKVLNAFVESLYFETVEANSSILTQYSDSGEISSWARSSILWALNLDIITGMDDGTLNPGGGITRAQVATILERFISTYAMTTTQTDGSGVDYQTTFELPHETPNFLVFVDNTGRPDFTVAVYMDNTVGIGGAFSVSAGERYIVSGLGAQGSTEDHEIQVSIVCGSDYMDASITSLVSAQPFVAIYEVTQ